MAIERRRTAATMELPITTALWLLVEDEAVGGVWEDEGDVDVLLRWEVVCDTNEEVTADEAFLTPGVDVVDNSVE